MKRKFSGFYDVVVATCEDISIDVSITTVRLKWPKLV